MFCYLFPTASAALRPKFEKELKDGTRIVMESFPIPGWKPVKSGDRNGRSFYYYTMPPERTSDYDSVNTNPTYDYTGYGDYL